MNAARRRCTSSAPARATRCCSPGGPPTCWPRPTSWWPTGLSLDPIVALARPGPSGATSGARPDGAGLALDAVADLLADARPPPGGTVVRLKSGDPFVCSRGAEEAAALAARGVRCEVDARASPPPPPRRWPPALPAGADA